MQLIIRLTTCITLSAFELERTKFRGLEDSSCKRREDFVVGVQTFVVK